MRGFVIQLRRDLSEKVFCGAWFFRALLFSVTLASMFLDEFVLGWFFVVKLEFGLVHGCWWLC
jgi:hypothetical protein